MATRVTIAPGHWLAPEAAESYARLLAAGMPTGITDAGRTYDEQLALWKRQGHLGLAWHPDHPRANHLKGLALDLPRDAAAWLDTAKGRSHGWRRTIAAEWWHFEYFQHLDEHKDDDMPLTDEDIARIWRYKNERLTDEDAYSLLRAVRTIADAVARIESAIKAVRTALSELPVRVWGFKRAADPKPGVRGADRVDMVQLLADAVTKLTGKTPAQIKHPAQRKAPDDF